ncbi:hypothetical protein RV18_GL003287 [Enterococcus termitis]|nr:hypothetical protein RV18_GL003287 [Enterococcus termitis]
MFQLTEKKNLFQLVIVRLVQLGLSIVFWLTIAIELGHYLQAVRVSSRRLVFVLILTLLLKTLLTKWIERLTYRASSELRIGMRKLVMEKAFRLGQGQGQLSSATLAQLSVDGIEQLEIYYARFLPQLFYCLFASLLIFGTLVSFAWQPAVVLLICMPLIPLIIMSVMKIAKRILSGYWTKYTDLGAKFHENLSGLSTLKAYHQDEAKQIEAAADAERFRKVTMSLLSMQLNSITIMDIVSYCGAALGIGLALFSYQQQAITLVGMLMFILLSAEFFIPMRQLGSLFHVAMNGISACKKLFTYLELPEQVFGEKDLETELAHLKLQQVNFSYQGSDQLALKEVSLTVKQGEFTALVGTSGSGKSTVVRLLLHQLSGYEGQIYWNDVELRELTQEVLKSHAILVDNHGFIYPMTIKENLLLGNETASEEELWAVLEKVQLTSFVQKLPETLNEPLEEDGANLSGGQRQRLLLARALLRGGRLYIFDEITSGVDLRSEEIILNCLQELAKTSMVIFISHRLYNVSEADQIYVFENGQITAHGTPNSLQKESAYFKHYFDQEERLIAGGEHG